MLLIADTLRLLGQGTNVAVEVVVMAISDHQQSWGYEDGPWKGPRPPLLEDADF